MEKTVPAVDLWFKDPEGQEYVLEHTLIESFPEQLQDKTTFDKVFRPLAKELAGGLPGPACYTLEVAADQLDNMNKYELARNYLKHWVKSKAARLNKIALKNKEKPAAEKRECSIEEELPGVAAAVRLTREEGENNNLTIKRRLPENLGEKRKTRMEKALADKCPKLQEAKGEKRRSILLLEMLADRISNHLNVVSLLKELLPARDDNPDEIYLVETGNVPWQVFVLKDGEAFFPDIKNPGPHQL